MGGPFQKRELRAPILTPSLAEDRERREAALFTWRLSEYRRERALATLSIDPAHFETKLPADQCMNWTVNGEAVVLDTHELIDSAFRGRVIVRGSDGRLYTYLRALKLGLFDPSIQGDKRNSHLPPKDDPSSVVEGGPA